jgi:membrane protease YdiL (CAAX protease family)
LINFILVNLWEETAWAGVIQTRLERRHSIFVGAALTAVPFGFIHRPLAFLSDICLASVSCYQPSRDGALANQLLTTAVGSVMTS